MLDQIFKMTENTDIEEVGDLTFLFTDVELTSRVKSTINSRNGISYSVLYDMLGNTLKIFEIKIIDGEEVEIEHLVEIVDVILRQSN